MIETVTIELRERLGRKFWDLRMAAESNVQFSGAAT
jgi:hypothetical protein